MMKRKCHHSEALDFLLKDWASQMAIPTDIEEEACNLFRNGGLKIKILRNSVDDPLFLAVYQENEKLSILHTISKRMKTPICTNCSRTPCPCLGKLKSKSEPKIEQNESERPNGADEDMALC